MPSGMSPPSTTMLEMLRSRITATAGTRLSPALQVMT